MERTPKPDKGIQKGYAGIDGFVSNRRSRVINEPFTSRQVPTTKLSSTGNLQPKSDADVSSARVMQGINMKQPAKAGVAWSPRIQDPSDIELTRKTGRKSHRAKKEPEKQRNWKKIAKRSSLTVAALILILGGYLGFKFFHNIDKVFGGNVFSNLSSLFGTTTLKGESSGRVNILLAGDSADQINHGGQNLTDSVLVLSIDTNNHTAFLLSIPRDLWVKMPNGEYPGGTYQKINAANDINNFSSPGFPNGGMGALSYVVQNDLGIPIDYYGVMDYGAFKDSVNAVGGVRIDIQSPDPRGLYDSNTNLNLPNGWVSLNGQQALNLARARGDGYRSYGFPDSDFNRTQHQRQLFIAVAQKADSIGVLSNPDKISNLFDALGNNFQTNLNISDVLALIHVTKNINPSSIQSYAYCSSLTVGQNGCKTPILTTYVDGGSGEDALIPTAGIGDYQQMTQYYQKLTSNNPVIKEGASVVILNGGNTNGLAKTYESYLIPKGIFVASASDAQTTYLNTEVMDDSGGKDPSTSKLLQKVFGNNIVPNQPSVNTTNANFVIILGENQQPPN